MKQNDDWLSRGTRFGKPQLRCECDRRAFFARQNTMDREASRLMGAIAMGVIVFAVFGVIVTRAVIAKHNLAIQIWASADLDRFGPISTPAKRIDGSRDAGDVRPHIAEETLAAVSVETW